MLFICLFTRPNIALYVSFTLSLCAKLLLPTILIISSSLVPKPFIDFLNFSASFSALKPGASIIVPCCYNVILINFSKQFFLFKKIESLLCFPLCTY